MSAGEDACWPYTGRLTHDGYGLVDSGGKTLLAHKIALEAKLGRPLAPGEVTRHGLTCTTRACCNPGHLQPGSKADNSADAVAAGRTLRGELNPAAKLTADQVLEIRRRAASMGYGKFEALGRQYGVTGKQIALICNGERWPALPASDRRRLRALTTPADLRRIKRLARQLVAGAITGAEAEARAVAK